MQLKNIAKFTYLDSIKLTAIIYRTRLYIAMLLAIILMAASCRKSKPPEFIANVLEQYFESNILNRDFRVVLAKDSNTVLTSVFDGYTFRLLKNTYYEGPMMAIKSGASPVTYTGTWACSEDFGKLTININQPSVPGGFNFINRSWRFEKKEFPVMKLAPWGSSTDTVKLNMERL